MLNPDFKAFVSALDARGVRYMVVGGYAVAFHGYPRYTKDLDIWGARRAAFVRVSSSQLDRRQTTKSWN